MLKSKSKKTFAILTAAIILISILIFPSTIVSAGLSQTLTATNGVTVKATLTFDKTSYVDGEAFTVTASLDSGVTSVYAIFSGNSNKQNFKMANDKYFTFSNPNGMSAGQSGDGYYRTVTLYAVGYSGRIYQFSPSMQIKVSPNAPPTISMTATSSNLGPQITVQTDGTELYYTLRQGSQVITHSSINSQYNTWDLSKWNLSSGTYTFEAQSTRNGIASECKSYSFTIAQVAAFSPTWPAPGNYQISTLTKYDNGATHGTWNGRNKYSAMDITGNSGDKIVAVESGTILDAGWSSGGFGYYVRIQHNDDLKTESLYGHLKEASSFTKGMTVNKGDAIGKMGNTGGNYGVHLHFELYNRNPWKDFYNNPNSASYVPNLTYTMGAAKYKQAAP